MPKTKSRSKTATAKPSIAQSEEQTIQQLNERFQLLNEQKIKVQTQRDHAVERLAELKAEAKKEFGTDDLEELESMLEQMKSENEQKRNEYQKKLDRIEQSLAEIDEKFVDAELEEGDEED